jgi:hypothetical protein
MEAVKWWNGNFTFAYVDWSRPRRPVVVGEQFSLEPRVFCM